MNIRQTWLIDGEHTMRCAGCVQTVEYSLSRLSGVEQVKASRDNQQIEVEMIDDNTKELIITELANLGYKVKELENDDTNN